MLASTLIAASAGSVLLSILSVIGIILKWILIVLGCILGLVLVIVLIVLLDPFFYHIRGNKESEDIKANVKVFYLFHILRVTAAFEDKKLSWRVTVFGIQIAGSDEVPEKDRSKEARKKRREGRKLQEAAGTAGEGGGISSETDDSKSPTSLKEAVESQKDAAYKESLETVRKEVLTTDKAEKGPGETAPGEDANPEVPGAEASVTEASGEADEVTVRASREGLPESEIVVTGQAKADERNIQEAMRRARARADKKVEEERLKREKEEAAAAKAKAKNEAKFQKELEKLRKQQEKARIKAEKEKERARKQAEKEARKNQPKQTLSEKIDALIDKAFDLMDKVFDTVDMILDAPDKLDEKLEPVEKYYDLFEDYPDKGETIKALLRVVGKILKPLVPKGCQIDALFGTGDPFTTARISGIYLTLAPLLFPEQSGKRYLNIQTDMMEKVIDFDAYLKGHFHLGGFIGPVLAAPFNKYIFRLIKFVLKLLRQNKKEKKAKKAKEI